MDICAANNLFAVEVLKEIGRSDVGQNIVFAPFSIITALSMIYLGARGNTATQMGKVLHFTEVNGIHASYKNLMHNMVVNNKEYVLKNVNKLFGKKTLQFLPTFLNDLENFYGAGLEQLDFSANPEPSRDYINAWISEQTGGKIPELLPAGSISTETELVLANTLYFAANWTRQFHEVNTYEAPFTKISNDQVMADMMFRTGLLEVKYMKNPGVKVLELPYGASKDFNMVVILPDDNSLLKQVKDLLDQLDTLLSDLETQYTEVHLPRFKIEQHLSMKNILSSMGILDAFSQNKADFSGMTGRRSLFVSEAYHQTVLNVDESGTEAASASAFIGSSRSMIGLVVKADHPFFYIIRHKKSNCILLCGIVHDPLRTESALAD